MKAELETAPKICSACGVANVFDATRCEGCDRARFAPPWVRALRDVESSFSVQVRDPHEDSDATTPVLSFYRSRRGGYSTFNIYEQSHWERVKRIVDSEFRESLGWKSGDELGGPDDPRLLLAVAETLAAAPLAELGPGALRDARERIAKLAAKVEDAQRAATRGAIENVSEDRRTAVQQIADLIGAQARGERIAAEVELRRRVGMLELLRERLADERSYKLVNHRSAIHRLIERSIWAFGESYWLVDEAGGLRTALDRAALAEGNAYARKPDFACAVEDGRLLVVSARPPGRELGVADLDKLERHVATCHAHGSFRGFEAILVGEAVSDELRQTLPLRDSSFQVRTYDEVVEKPLRSYVTRLRALAS